MFEFAGEGDTSFIDSKGCLFCSRGFILHSQCFFWHWRVARGFGLQFSSVLTRAFNPSLVIVSRIVLLALIMSLWLAKLKAPPSTHERQCSLSVLPFAVQLCSDNRSFPCFGSAQTQELQRCFSSTRLRKCLQQEQEQERDWCHVVSLLHANRARRGSFFFSCFDLDSGIFAQPLYDSCHALGDNKFPRAFKGQLVVGSVEGLDQINTQCPRR